MAEGYLDTQLNQTTPSTLANQFQAPTYNAPEPVSIQPASTYSTPETKVSNQLKDLLSSDSPLLTLASTRAKEQANKLGLLSSSMAVGAGVREATKEMLPVAQADAASATQFAHQQQQAEAQNQINLQQGLVSGALNTQNLSGQAGLSGVQGDINSQLQKESAMQKATISAQEAAQNKSLQTTLQQAELNMKARLAELELTSKDRSAISSSVSELQLRYMADTTTITTDNDMTPEAKATALSNLEKMYTQNSSSIAAIYGTQLDWGSASTPTSQAQTAPVYPTPPPPPPAPLINELYDSSKMPSIPLPSNYVWTWNGVKWVEQIQYENNSSV